MEKNFYSTSELGQWLGVFHTTVRRWIESGKIRGVRVGRNYKIPADEAVKILDRFDIPIPDALRKHALRLRKTTRTGPQDKGVEKSFLKKLLVVDSVDHPAAVCRDDAILGANQPFSDLFGLSQVEIIGRPLNEFIMESSGEKLSQFARRRLEEPQSQPERYPAKLKTTESRKDARLQVTTVDHVKDVYMLVVYTS